ncbi:FAD/NAD(P)-binding protein [Patescibacteria group bacterium]|nr:FAD/NAD(P)-binding protein [Patescibacteria group bacterium]MBU1867966.1 FAD/NAD(P)-binding protein [Patescibacteria group bacterium]
MELQSDYKPELVQIREIKDLCPDVKLFRLDHILGFNPGQFIELSVLGAGEIPVVITSHPAEDFIELAVRKVGTVTTALHKLREGDVVGIRGPFGNGFSLPQLRGKNLVLVGGGLGLVPLRPLIKNILLHRSDYGEIYLLYGCRDPYGFLFKKDLKEWEREMNLYQTIDEDCPDWEGHVGVVTALFKKIDFPPNNLAAVICGPPVMFKFVIEELKEICVSDDRIFMSLERHMKCGVGKCQHCTLGKYYVCVDGPVFSYEQLRNCDWQ